MKQVRHLQNKMKAKILKKLRLKKVIEKNPISNEMQYVLHMHPTNYVRLVVLTLRSYVIRMGPADS